MDQPATLASFDNGLQAVVIGASGGLGRAFTEHLAEHPKVGSVLACSRSGAAPGHDRVRPWPVDLEDEKSIAAAAEQAGPDLDLVIVAAGVLHGDGFSPEKTWRALDPDALATVFRLNAIGPALAAKHFLPRLARDRKSVFAALSARVGSIEDNQLGGWHSYRASKAALNMLMRNFAIELARTNKQAVCVGLHPGTVDTGLSKPFQGNVPDGKLFTPAFAAARLLDVLDGLSARDTGGLFAWDGARIPF